MKSAGELDAMDPLADVRRAFKLPSDKVYLDGNSLGALPTNVLERLRSVVEAEWGADLITSWNAHAWIDLPTTTGDRIGNLVGAAPGQVLVCDSISVNLFKLLAFALALRPGRARILSDSANFPTDLYIAQGLQQLVGTARCELEVLPVDELADAVDERVAAVMLTHVDFRSGQIHDMARWTELAHSHGALMLWDLAHSAGAMPLMLDALHVDLAVGCGYKYLNGGPGAPAYVYVAGRHQQAARQPIAGWMGHAAPFDFEPVYEPASDIRRFLSGTPPILSLSALDAALGVFDGLDLKDVRAKSVALGEHFLQLLGKEDVLAGFELASPSDPHERGSHLVLRHPFAYEVCQALIERGVITDFRAPDLLRIGFAPLYVRFADVARCVEILAEIFATGRYRDPKFATRARVT